MQIHFKNTNTAKDVILITQHMSDKPERMAWLAEALFEGLEARKEYEELAKAVSVVLRCLKSQPESVKTAFAGVMAKVSA